MDYVGPFDTVQQSHAEEGHRSCCPACRCWLIAAQYDIKSLPLLSKRRLIARCLSCCMNSAEKGRF